MTNEEAFNQLKKERPIVFRTVRIAVFMLWSLEAIENMIERSYPGEDNLPAQCRQAAEWMQMVEVEAETAGRSAATASEGAMPV